MAEQKTDTEVTEESEKEKSSPPRKGLPMPLIIVAIVLAIAALGGGGFFLFTLMQPAEASEEDVEEAEEGEENTETNIFFTGFQTSIVNLEVSGDYPFMYLKYGFDVEVESNAVVTEMLTKLPRLEAKVAGVMSSRDWTEISTAQGRERLARDCLS